MKTPVSWPRYLHDRNLTKATVGGSLFFGPCLAVWLKVIRARDIPPGFYAVLSVFAVFCFAVWVRNGNMVIDAAPKQT